MFRTIWRWPLYGSNTPSVVTITYTESWAFRVGVQPVQVSSSASMVRGVPELVERAHKEN